MSQPVALERLRGEVERRSADPFLLTVDGEGRPHAVASSVAWDGGELLVPAGERSTANAERRPAVSLLWPPSERGDYSLIVDGTATLEGVGRAARLRVTPTRGVLHRAAAADTPTKPGCTADCVPLLG
jgi:hypothetical protein